MGFSRDFGLILVGRDRSNRKVHTVCLDLQNFGVVWWASSFFKVRPSQHPWFWNTTILQVWNIYRQAPKSLATLTPTLEAR